jgi:hypothetical protein
MLGFAAEIHMFDKMAGSHVYEAGIPKKRLARLFVFAGFTGELN